MQNNVLYTRSTNYSLSNEQKLGLFYQKSFLKLFSLIDKAACKVFLTGFNSKNELYQTDKDTCASIVRHSLVGLPRSSGANGSMFESCSSHDFSMHLRIFFWFYDAQVRVQWYCVYPRIGLGLSIYLCVLWTRTCGTMYVVVASCGTMYVVVASLKPSYAKPTKIADSCGYAPPATKPTYTSYSPC